MTDTKAIEVTAQFGARVLKVIAELSAEDDYSEAILDTAVWAFWDLLDIATDPLSQAHEDERRKDAGLAALRMLRWFRGHRDERRLLEALRVLAPDFEDAGFGFIDGFVAQMVERRSTPTP